MDADSGCFVVFFGGGGGRCKHPANHLHSDHVNDYCALSSNNATQQPELWMCYGGATGFGGYAGYGGYHRRVRLFDIDANIGRIVTWKRLEYGDIEARIDEQMIVDAGRPVAPPVSVEQVALAE